MFEEFELKAYRLRNIYWLIRADRCGKRRTYYRRAAKEKGHLVALGYCPEFVRLYALYLRNPKAEHRRDRARTAFKFDPEQRPEPVQYRLF